MFCLGIQLVYQSTDTSRFDLTPFSTYESSQRPGTGLIRFVYGSIPTYLARAPSCRYHKSECPKPKHFGPFTSVRALLVYALPVRCIGSTRTE